MEKKALENQLEQELIDACRESAKYIPLPVRFISMVKEYGAIEASKKVINTRTPPDGYIELLAIGQLRLSVEYIIIQPEYRELFDETTLKIAESRLR